MNVLRVLVGGMISAVWCATFYSAIHNPELIALATIATPVFMLVVGALFGQETAKAIRGIKRDEPR